MALTDDEMCAALAEVMGNTVVPRDQLDDLLADAGYRVRTEDVDRQLQFDSRFVELRDGLAYLPALTEGVGFALWVDPETAAEDYLLMHPALEVIGWWIVEGPVDLFDEAGQRVGVIESDGWLIDGVDTDVVLGPDGWLEEVAGSWIAFRVKRGTLVIERLTDPPPVEPARATAVGAAFDVVAEHQLYHPYGTDEPVDVMRAHPSTVLQEAIGQGPSLFTGEPLPTTVDLLAAAQLRLQQRWVVPADLDQEILAAAETERRAMARWGVDADTALGAQVLLGAIGLHAEGHPDAFGASSHEREMAPALFAGLLQRESIARIIGYECASGEVCPRALGFAEAIAAVFDDDPRIWGPAWLVAHCHLALGNADAAAELLDGLPSGIDCLPVLIDRAMLAADRSRAQDAHRLVLAAGRLAEDLPDLAALSYVYQQQLGELHDEVEMWASNPPPVMARRNDRCPCGSGRKYKTCHAGRELHPIEDRAAWLHQKMTRFARAGEPDEIDTLASAMADAMDSPESWATLVDTPFITDIVLHEEELAQRFLDGRRSTLPEDETLLAQQWMLVDRSVFEVETARPGHLGLRDLATGDGVEVSNVGPGPTSTPGSIILGRPLPVGNTYRALSGFMAVRPDLVADALAVLDAGDPDELVAFLGSMHRPPAIQNTDGHDMALTDITWSMPGHIDVSEALTRAGFTGGDGTWRLVLDTANQPSSVIASLQIDGDRLEGHVNSTERAQELLELIAEHVPDAVHLETKLTDLDEIDLTDPPALSDQATLMEDPDVRAAIEAHFARYEDEWLDSPNPALGDRTPREAAADPIAREDLVRLLATFPEPAARAGGMSAERLRVALGL
ncbi:MAG: SEC-C domain-containing protein [Actinomycetia bacterium]|nr:SEC-C domain-containing protein [Actinomycetes bacterium]